VEDERRSWSGRATEEEGRKVEVEGRRERWVMSSEWVEVWEYAGALVFRTSLKISERVDEVETMNEPEEDVGFGGDELGASDDEAISITGSDGSYGQGFPYESCDIVRHVKVILKLAASPLMVVAALRLLSSHLITFASLPELHTAP
jgi:hypothetical protein